MLLSVFQWIDRKNPEALLTAYFTEFTRDDPVVLVLKTYGSSFSPEKKKEIKERIDYAFQSLNLGIPKRYRARVALCAEPLDDDELPLIYRSSHGIISASCGEGFCLPVAEAMSSGCIPVVTGWSGQAELVEKMCGYRVGYVLEPAKKQQGNIWYSARQNWASIRINSLRGKMRELVRIHNKREKIFNAMSKNSRESIVRRFSPGAVARKLNKILKEIRD